MWGRLDDHAWQNEKLIGLSNAAHCLYWIAISFAASEWPQGLGRLSPERARALARMHSICEPDDDSIDVVLAELVAKRCWIRQPRMFAIHDIKRYMPPADLSEKRAAAGRKGRKARSTNEKALALATANAEHLPQQTSSKGSPVPDPVPVPTVPPLSPNGDVPPLLVVVSPSTAASNGTGTKHRPPGKGEATAEQLRTFTDAWNANCDPLPRMKGPPEAKANRDLVMRVVRYFAGDEAAMARSMKRCSADKDYRENGWGFASYCRHIEDRWGTEPVAVLASAASSWD